MPNPILTIETYNGQKITAELFLDRAKNSIQYFLSYVNTGYYDGLPFHSCLKDQYIQCGYWESSGYGSPAFVDEKEEGIVISENIKPEVGTIAFVTAKYPNTAKLQFAILLTDQPIYNQGTEILFSPLGKVIDGLDAVKEISRVEVDEELYPLIPQLIKKITVEEL